MIENNLCVNGYKSEKIEKHKVKKPNLDIYMLNTVRYIRSDKWINQLTDT